MTTMLVMPSDDTWTVDDLDRLPDDGLQYELFDGVLVVSAAPTVAHQRLSQACYRALHAACPPHLETFMAPLDFQPNRRRSFQPDVLVARRDSLGVKNLTIPPLLVVEVLSAGTRSKDLIFKREMYASSGVQAYWVLDPDEVSLVAHELTDGAYRRSAEASGDHSLTVTFPFTVTLCPADLAVGR
jgi:Uma2 family endonuclease